MDLDDDPYRSLIWKLKKEGLITPQPQIPYHEFRWGAWLRRRPLPPFRLYLIQEGRQRVKKYFDGVRSTHKLTNDFGMHFDSEEIKTDLENRQDRDL